MNWTPFAFSAFVALFFGCALAKPLNKGPPHPKPVEANSPEERFDLGLHYEHYLKQVVEELEKDQEFKKKLDSANLTDIKSGKIASYLELVNHTIRTKLDELKRKEIHRLKELVLRSPRTRGVDKFQVDHLDKKNMHSFEVQDLEALIKTATQDLEALDEQRRKEFKQHEMDKEAHKREKLKHMQDDERKKEEERLKEVEKRHKNHPKMHHPGSKDQMEEVWEKSDHLEEQDFDPRTFFMKHDLNGDFMWDEEEIDSVLQVELDKVYDPNNPEEDDPWEREEEMNRMREHIMKEMDKDQNKFISIEEFLAYTGLHGENPEFQKDEGWETIDEQDPVYTEDELNEYLTQFENQPGVVDNLPAHDMKFQSEHAGQQQQFQPPQQQQHQQQPSHQLSQEQLQQQVLELQQKLSQQQLNQAQQLNQQQMNQQQQQAQQQMHQQQQLNQQQMHQQQQQLNQQQVHQQQPPQQQLNQQQQPPQHQQQPNAVPQAPQQGQMPAGH